MFLEDFPPDDGLTDTSARKLTTRNVVYYTHCTIFCCSQLKHQNIRMCARHGGKDFVNGKEGPAMESEFDKVTVQRSWPECICTRK